MNIPSSMFYGNPQGDVLCRKYNKKAKELPKFKHRLLDPNDPSSTWNIFKKQESALEFARRKKNNLMVFAFQHTLGQRLFLAADPVVFWYYDSKRASEERCSYEIIPENTVCKLYFDLEFDRQINDQSDGSQMVSIFIQIVSHYIKQNFGIRVNRKNILELDSSTDQKFSCHLIYDIPGAVFMNNQLMGSFVKYICEEISSLYSLNVTDHDGRCVKKCGVDFNCVRKLFITDRKGKEVLFCDQSVYSKNRHFRLFHSTKWGRNAPLLVSANNLYKSYSEDSADKLNIFLDSLVTYLTYDDHNVELLGFGSLHKDGNALHKFCSSPSLSTFLKGEKDCPFPELQQYFTNIVNPGRVWRWGYFSSNSCIIFDIVGYRFCGNIQRQHKSNNISFVVNLQNWTYYQKCYDPDCIHYRSKSHDLPVYLRFLLEDDSVLQEALKDISVGCFAETSVEVFANEASCVLYNSPIFPDFGLSDNELLLSVNSLDCFKL